MSSALQALIESGQVEDGDADLVEPQGQALPELPKPDFTMVAAWVESGGTPSTRRKDLVLLNDVPVFKEETVRAYASQLALPAGLSDEQIKEFCKRVTGAIADYDDRSSPEGQPEMMLVTADELAAEIRAAFALGLPAGPVPEGDALDAQRYRKAVSHGIIVLHNGAKACVGKDEADVALDAIATSPAVKQPVAFDSMKLLITPGRLKKITGLFEDADQMIGLEQFFEAAYKIIGECMSRADAQTGSVTVAQPVADERAIRYAALEEAKEACRKGGLDFSVRIITELQEAPARAGLCQPAEEGGKS